MFPLLSKEQAFLCILLKSVLVLHFIGVELVNRSEDWLCKNRCKMQMAMQDADITCSMTRWSMIVVLRYNTEIIVCSMHLTCY